MASPTGQTGKGLFPKTLLFMDTEEVDRQVRAEAEEREVSLSVVLRELVADGRRYRELKLAAKKRREKSS